MQIKPQNLAAKTIGVTSGVIEDQKLTKLTPASTTMLSFVASQVQLVAMGASVAGNMIAKNPQLNTEYELLLKDSPNFIAVGKILGGLDKMAVASSGQSEETYRKFPVCPNEKRPGCGHTVRPCGSRPTATLSTAPLSVLKRYTSLS